MILIVGLGNPGRKFQKTRHNIGFRVVGEFVKKNSFPSFRISKKFSFLISEGFLNNEKIVVVKPQTFMNKSGKVVGSLIKNLKVKSENLFVIHDDTDLPLGKIKIVKNRGAAGHKGVESIIEELKTKSFVRFRIGIRPAVNNKREAPKIKELKDFVLQKFYKKEEKIVRNILEKTVEAIEMTLREGIEKAMNKYNK